MEKDRNKERVEAHSHQGLVIAVVSGAGWNGSLGLLFLSNLITGEELTQFLRTDTQFIGLIWPYSQPVQCISNIWTEY